MSVQTNDQYQVDIGIETHVQLACTSKLFSATPNPVGATAPNTHTSPLCFGLPGTLPVLNQAAIKLAIRAGLALNAQIATKTKFDRKHYFYPDLPKGYQITQYDEPIIGAGKVKIPLAGKEFSVRIERAHLEEDAGKSLHPAGSDYSLVDLNRAGAPLLEIVSRPDLHSPQQARAYAQELQHLMRYAGVSDADLYLGNMRFDLNISLRPKGEKKLGVRTEIKNLNSFRSVERAAEYEIKRQAERLSKGKAVIQETLGWDEAKGRVVVQRSKEEAHDYRYFPEPDLPPLVIAKELVAAVKAELPPLPAAIRAQLSKAGVADGVIETLLGEPRFAALVLDLAEPVHAKRVANWLAVDVRGELSAKSRASAELKLNSRNLGELATMVTEGQLSSTAAKTVLFEMLNSSAPPQEIAARLQVLQQSAGGELEAWVEAAIADNPQAANDYLAGEAKAVGFLVGRVMQLSGGRANPAKVRALLEKKLQQS